MSTVRQLLECLGRKSLVRLMRGRSLSAARKNEARKERLARSYRGDVEALIQDLNRDELVSIFRRVTFVLQDEELYLPNPGKYRLDELHAFALKAFADLPGRIPGEFRRAPEPNTGLDEYDDEEEDEHDNEEDEGEYDEDEHDDEEDENVWKSAGAVSPARGTLGDWCFSCGSGLPSATRQVR